MTHIGIDTGVNTGFAVWDSSRKKFIDLETLTIHQAMEKVLMWKDIVGKDNLVVSFEDARQRKWFTGGKEKQQGAGSIKRDSSIWEDFLKDKGITFRMVAPKDNMTKMDAAPFKAVTGWQGRTSYHARDAAMLVFGR